ncbi:glycosyltransferase family 4 protein [Arthrobacter sp. NPDC080073]|uniref:glycosyltransferase family 4 protein n=1 Tax=Arthrobacter sp. NPDC080073 TaxID=3155919 RepID=UPI0034198FF0
MVSDLSYPPAEGLHQQTLLLVRGLKDQGVEVELHGFVKSLRALDEEALYREHGIAFASPPSEQPRSLLVSAIRNLFPFSRAAGPLRRRLYNLSQVDVIHFEGIAACAVSTRRLASRSILSFIDPGSRRNFRFFRQADGFLPKVVYFATGFVYLGVERLLRRGNPIWHVVSDDDRRYLSEIHGFDAVIAIPVSLPAELSGEEMAKPEDFAGEAQLHRRVDILVYADLRQQHMRDALKVFARKVFRSYVGRRAVEFTILGRVELNAEFASWFEGLNYKFIAWAEDYLAVLRKADIVLLPDSVGTGLKNRAIQSLAAGVPVVGTSIAMEGLDLRNGIDAFVVDSAEASKVPLQKLVADRALRLRIGEAGRSRVIQEFGTKSVVKRWIDTYSEIQNA